ncbi:MAG: ribosome small subunit-dependent GTPase A [Gammaproteobacteria bacterium]|nr:ribosome small subunit-dependent GTPase A [Gammaproteobacteria bacterium]
MTQQTASVVATFSRRMRLRLQDDSLVEARIKGKKLKPVCGDQVIAEPIDKESDWLITRILDRDNELTRPNMRGQVEVLAANLEALVVVAAVSPLPDWYIVDRYLCAAELMGASAIVVFNKADLLEGHDIEIDELDEYRDIGLPVIETSAETGGGIDELQSALGARRAIVVGQSGVGKSSIINQLVGDAKQRTADISGKTGEGRHTTVNSVLIPLRDGGAVIDSPGVRDYAPALANSCDAALGFREIAAAAEGCRFANCRHLREPGCAVKDAVDAGEISERRYESFRRVVNLTEKLAESRY